MAIAQESDSAGHWTLSQYEKALTEAQPRRVALVLEEVAAGEGTIVGFVVAAEIAHEWELENIAVASSARRRGHANRLLGALLDALHHGAAKSIYLEVRVSNEAARRLYEKWGFERVGRRLGYYHSPPEDAILYKKNLVTSAREIG